jgi:hypothetical protein
MRILLDHCVDRRFARSLPAHDVKSAQQMGWDKLKNGALLAAAAHSFDLFLTFDRNLKHPQNLEHLPIPVVVLIGRSNRLIDLVPLVPALERAMANLMPNTVVEIAAS